MKFATLGSANEAIVFERVDVLAKAEAKTEGGKFEESQGDDESSKSAHFAH